MSRLGGRGITAKYGMEEGFLLSTHDTVSQAVERVRRGNRYMKSRKRDYPDLSESVIHQMMNGDAKLESLKERADLLMDQALIEDPRLVKRAGWVRDEDGVDCDASLVAAGEEQCCLNRKRMKVSDASTLEPVRVVISTDSNEVSDEHAIAFMAAAKISQQFRPLEIWWQGAWLTNEDYYNHLGHVALTPLLRNELDFGRLQFVLSSNRRDHISYQIMASYTMADPDSRKAPMLKYGAHTGKKSFLPDTVDFVNEAGIQHSPYYVAQYAAKWAGLEPLWEERIYGSEAEQCWAPKDNAPYTPTQLTAEQRRRYDQQCREREAEEKRKLKERLTSV